MEKFELYVKFAVFAFYILVALFVSIRSIIKSLKNKTENNTTKSIYEQYVEIFAKAKEFIEEAEQFKNYSAEEKFNYALTRLKQISQSIFDELGLKNLINSLVDFTKKVNVAQDNSKKN